MMHRMLQPQKGTIIYRLATATDDDERTETFRIPVDGHVEHHSADMRLSLDADGDALHLAVQAQSPLTIVRCTLNFAYSFTADDRLLMNGYQSWTDTRPLSPNARMRSLAGVPKSLVVKYVLDGGGDYRFTAYPDRAGCLHGFTYAVVERDKRVLLAGSLGEDDGFTVLRTDCANGLLSAEKEPPAAPLRAGERWTPNGLAWIEAAGDHALDDAYDRWFALMGVKARPAHPLVGYTSWYRHYDAIDEDRILDDLQATASTLATFDCSGFDKVFQIDDGYAKVGDWQAPEPRKFPHGMEPLAHDITVAGLVPGLWTAPFVCEKKSQLFAEHPEWLLRDEQGEPVKTGSHWSGGYALDTLHPAVREHVRQTLRMMTQQWGFRLIKADFLYAACLLPHGGRNRGQLMADAMDLLRESAGNARLLCCGVPLASAFGKTEYCRIGCDVGLDWDGPLYMQLLHRERVSTKNSLAATLARAPLDGRAFGNDPDVFFLRKDVHLSFLQRRQLLDTDAQQGRVLLTSDDMSTWDKADRTLFAGALYTVRRRMS